MKRNPQKDITISEELRTAKQIIDHGLESLQNVDFVNDHYNVIFLLLSNGIERLLKITIILHLIEKHEKYPATVPWPNGKKGHDLERLLYYIIENCFTDDYKRIPMGKNEYEYLRKNLIFQKSINIISRFGQGLRYANIDLILSENTKSKNESPEQLWSSLEREILGAIDPKYNNFLNPEKTNEIFREVIGKIHSALKKV